MAAVVLVEDDPPYAEELVEFLHRHGMKVVWFRSFGEMAANIRRLSPNLLVLDQFVAGQDAVMLLPDLRRGYGGGILLLTGNQDPTDRIVALETGADDFVAKSLGPRELIARMRAVLRRLGSRSDMPVRQAQAGQWVIDGRRNKVQAPNGISIHLTNTELEMLIYLINNSGRLISRDELSAAVLRRGYLPEDRSVDNMLSRIRVILRPYVRDGHVIRSVRGRGYLFTGLDLAEESDLQLPSETTAGLGLAAEAENV